MAQVSIFGTLTKILSIEARMICWPHPFQSGEWRLFLEFTQKGVEFHQPLKTQPWGMTDFIVKDPDGNLLCFASRPTTES